MARPADHAVPAVVAVDEVEIAGAAVDTIDAEAAGDVVAVPGATEVVREPRTRVVKVGTKPMPTSVQGADGLNWQSLAACESGGD